MGSESRQLSSEGSCGVAEALRGPELVCQVGSTFAPSMLLCQQQPSTLPARISLCPARPCVLPGTESLLLAETNQQHSQQQSGPKTISPGHFRGRVGFSSLCISLGSLRVPWHPNPQPAGTSKVGGACVVGARMYVLCVWWWWVCVCVV